MTALLAAAAIACFLVGLTGCEVVRRIALKRALLDTVNERSLHTVPTPRLGGVAIVLTTLAASAAAWPYASREIHVLVAACAVIAVVGLRDDLRPVSALTRILIQIIVSTAFVLGVGTPPFLVARDVALALPPALVTALLVVWMVGVLNIYNFMDGMDGLAASQTVSACAAFAVILRGDSSLAGFALVLGAASLGFLVHNFPPARIFMGDAGSTFIGLAFAGLAISGMHHHVPITESALALTPFLLDGTFTILRRASRRERIWQAHRSHLYQRAAQTGLAHREVLIVYVGWIAIALGAAVLASFGRFALALGWAATTLATLVVWRWVVRLESKLSRLT